MGKRRWRKRAEKVVGRLEAKSGGGGKDEEEDEGRGGGGEGRKGW